MNTWLHKNIFFRFPADQFFPQISNGVQKAYVYSFSWDSYPRFLQEDQYHWSIAHGTVEHNIQNNMICLSITYIVNDFFSDGLTLDLPICPRPTALKGGHGSRARFCPTTSRWKPPDHLSRENRNPSIMIQIRIKETWPFVVGDKSNHT